MAQPKSSMGKIHLLSCLILLPVFTQCGQQPDQPLVDEVDSLVQMTLELQQRISSPEIQRLSEFQNEILFDLGQLGDSLSTEAEMNAGPPFETVDLYIDLNESLNNCLRACSQFHEEAYILETTLEEIKEMALVRDADLEALQERLEAEWEIYHDLNTRIDSSLKNAVYHAKIFYSLKPDIDQILIRAKQKPGIAP